MDRRPVEIGIEDLAEGKMKMSVDDLSFVRLIAKRKFSQHAHHDDLVQEGYIRLIRCRADFKDEFGVPFKAYASPRVTFAMLDYLRRWYGRSTQICILQMPDDIDHPECFDNHSYVDVQAALTRLSCRQEQILRMVFEDGLSGPEIAIVLKIGVMTVYTHKRRAMMTMSEILA